MGRGGNHGTFGFIMDQAGGDNVTHDTTLQLIISTLKFMLIIGGLENSAVRHSIIHNGKAIGYFVESHRDKFPRKHWPSIFFTLRKVPNQHRRTTYDDLFTWLLLIAEDIQKEGSTMSDDKLARNLKSIQSRRKREGGDVNG